MGVLVECWPSAIGCEVETRAAQHRGDVRVEHARLLANYARCQLGEHARQQRLHDTGRGLFSKLNRTFLGYFDPENILFT